MGGSAAIPVSGACDTGSEQITIEPLARSVDDRMILPVDVDESLSPVGSSFAESVEAGLGDNPLVEELPAAKPGLSGRSADDLLPAPFEEPLPDELSDSEIDAGDDETLSTEETLPSEIDTPLMGEIKEEEAGGEA